MANNFDELLEQVKNYQPSVDVEWLHGVFNFAESAHNGQTRASGDSFISHPLAVASILAELEMDPQTIAASLLHDVVEDTTVPIGDIERRFGSEIATLVDALTKLTKIPYQSKEDVQVENLRKMFLAMAKDIRVIIIKLADRLHNMRTLHSLTAPKQKAIAQETLEIYAPLAHRLGIYKMKWDLEDLSLRYIDPQAYRDIADKVAKRRGDRLQTVDTIIAEVQQRFSAAGLRADVSGRPKHFYSIYQKLQHGKDFSEIYDLSAIRVIVDSVKDCYGAVGIIHSLWTPLPGRFKDYIAMPKTNGYQSLHTTVIGPGGDPIEIQIRTLEMHRTSEYGIAAHWRYKEGGASDDFDEKLAWLRSLLEWQEDMRDSREFMENLKLDLFDNQVFVFTPKGDVMGFPAGATPIDFAYHIHTSVGHHCIGAKINGKIAPLDYALQNGDICEALVNKNSPGPSLDWLSICKTSSAKHKIKQWFRKNRREEHVTAGQQSLEREIARNQLSQIATSDFLKKCAARLNCATLEDLYSGIGFGDISVNSVIGRLREEAKRQNVVPLPLDRQTAAVSKLPPRATSGIKVRGVDSMPVRFSKCCTPVPGDAIVGFVSQGKGISVHRLTCPNIGGMSAQPERLIDVSWDVAPSDSHVVDVEIEALDRPGLLQDIMSVLSEQKTNATSVTARVKRDRTANIACSLQIRDLEHLSAILGKINRVRDVRSAYRVTKREARVSS
ncbi:MAG: (p)ppGpp synthetase [Candidatus Eremiobacter antarcticus]|nr:bifunctional (p)ppGpp synthetase/guanosine-3',5'-bis(diphosphate) 3'-pyrophosphohydrolase [Candidatus Eremiobacteraeota bacterium]MBC5807758.1 bifunctional (p)ppGpp synthetase/guanosine-3',5'-bis(diphosphate) 3'-pyrophosphohydrolase [Candidatus Eremiobacteraeota bacterium]PZR60622.1 MAG: (p)ppGpp synthetase [Candidatus Eremiobacter sp. RRmetagenome_bin22]